ncbi:arsenosugar biosynthesis radical SAM (seleno)protein ArsS [Neolewinella persica]|uniref:arsenosugar biosynthesis radical SAM (seleno)protein ArsS n=1 Tax=Neolewinella persica TaxID=70998 RepID=UPI00035F7D10|nr:arsenosugar biosynthesis radical SAM (seleno)protein ArsS [Neolewinella persica]
MAIKQKTKSLSVTGSRLSSTFVQLNVLNGKDISDAKFPRFSDKLATLGHQPFKPTEIEIFQLNIGKLCNQTCAHCHVDAGPDKKAENMSMADLEKCVELIAATPTIQVVDITGGAPEMHPGFRWFVEECTKLGKRVIDRCNLTIIMANPKYRDLPEFLAKHKVHVVSSLPYFSKKRTDGQRGDGVFEDSIKALQLLNEVGYGQPGSGLVLDLVFNPSGAYLPGKQEELQAEFKRQLDRKFGIVFNELYAITNLPVSRFLDYLIETGNYEEYMQKLVDAYNPSTVESLMCRNTVSVSWDGFLYDCDFNQMLDLKVAAKGQHLTTFDADELRKRNIVMNQHCYGCTAGAGSSCTGVVA